MSAPATTPPAIKAPPHTTRTILWSLLALAIAIPVIAVIVIATYDWNRARPWLNAKVTEALERPFAIRGDLTVQWQQPSSQMKGQDKQWRDYLPWPHLVARDVHLGNPAGMEQADSASIGTG